MFMSCPEFGAQLGIGDHIALLQGPMYRGNDFANMPYPDPTNP